MSENGNGSNKLVAYATAVAVGAGGVGAGGSTWWSKDHQHEDHQHEEIVELRRGLAEFSSIVKTREAVNKYWIERLRELEKRQRAGP